MFRSFKKSKEKDLKKLPPGNDLFNELPIEILIKIFSFLNSTRNIYAVNHRFNNAFVEYRKFEKDLSKAHKQIRKLFQLMNIGDIKGVKKIVPLNTLMYGPPGLSLLKLAKKEGNQNVLHNFYQLAINEIKDKTVLLHWAIHCHQPADTINQLISNGADINKKIQGANTLRLAVAEGQLKTVELLVCTYNADVNALSDSGTSLLLIATEFNHPEVLKFLLKQGANPNLSLIKNTPNHNLLNVKAGNTPLHVAVKLGRKKILQILLENGCDPNLETKDGLRPIHLAAIAGKADIAEFLLNHGAKVNACNAMGETALSLALKYKHVKVIKVLLHHYADISLLDAIKLGREDIVRDIIKGKLLNKPEVKDLNAALHLATVEGQAKIVKVLLKHGAEINACNDANETALLLAIKHDCKDIVNVLLDHKADVPLHAAIKLGRNDIVQDILNGNKVEVKDLNSALHLAAMEGNAEITELLLRSGADANACNADGATALLFAIGHNHINVVDVLIKYNADINIPLKVNYHKFKKNDTPLKLAIILNHQDILKKLLNKYKENVNKALHLAAMIGRAGIVELLIRDHNADVNTPTFSGATPLLLATKHNKIEVVKILLKYNADINISLDKNHESHNKFKIKKGDTPLDAAKKLKHKEIANLLTEYKLNCQQDNSDKKSKIKFLKM